MALTVWHLALVADDIYCLDPAGRREHRRRIGVRPQQRTATAHGFRAARYFLNGHDVLAFMGTGGGRFWDTFTADLKLTFSKKTVPKLFDDAMRWYSDVVAGYLTSRPVIFVGHSLGGGVAQYVGGQVGNALIVTFNPVGTRHLFGEMGTNVWGINFVMAGDTVSERGSFVGVKIRLPHGTKASGWDKLKLAHSMSRVLNVLKPEGSQKHWGMCPVENLITEVEEHRGKYYQGTFVQ